MQLLQGALKGSQGRPDFPFAPPARAGLFAAPRSGSVSQNALGFQRVRRSLGKLYGRLCAAKNALQNLPMGLPRNSLSPMSRQHPQTNSEAAVVPKTVIPCVCFAARPSLFKKRTRFFLLPSVALFFQKYPQPRPLKTDARTRKGLFFFCPANGRTRAIRAAPSPAEQVARLFAAAAGKQQKRPIGKSLWGETLGFNVCYAPTETVSGRVLPPSMTI